MEQKYKIIKRILILMIFLIVCVLVTSKIKDFKINKDESKKEDISINVLTNTDVITGLKKLPQLEYSVNDTVINVHEEDEYYKTFKKNKKYEIFLDKKSNDINSLHYTSKVKEITDEDVKYLQNIYNLAYSSMSDYLFEKTMSTIELMYSNDYIANKNSSIAKNGSLSETIQTGKTSQIKITIYYNYNGSKNEPINIDIGILKGNKW